MRLFSETPKRTLLLNRKVQRGPYCCLSGNGVLSSNVPIGQVFPYAAMVINALQKVPENCATIIINSRSKLSHRVVQRFLEFSIEMVNHTFDFDFCHTQCLQT